MKKILLFILILCSTPISFLFGASSKLDNPAQPQVNPVEIVLVSEQLGPEENNTTLSHPHLKYRGSLLLNSPHPAFGGFSDLLVSTDRKSFLAVSDMGFWLKGKLQYTSSGFLKGVERKAELGQLLNSEGKTFAIKYNGDAEALCRTPDQSPDSSTESGYLVAFERVHRINSYNSGKILDLSGKATPLPLPEQIKKSPLNGGIESMALLPDQSLFILTEGDDSAGSYSAAALMKNGKWTTFRYKRDSSFRPTSAACLPYGKILILERRYNGPGTLGIRLSTIEKGLIRKGTILSPKLFCELNPPIPRDNYEGLDAVLGTNANIWIYIISDDNFSPVQHTILSLFELTRGKEN
ncbi:esterase-like activity of phytase family protein [Desulfovibrio sp. JC010]|uniref:esterase-like activity of phytase family protein n=1 Tax=Desulfovibrio sp. JC010 TaxID=2593641 RepID=UPI0013D66822|nr:esterase-like activity of phytase family protein [Desulfovibrio sp. JC010]NDV26997.1 esterase-like activity of phytase family protein [Desulfovibrio sp. JC010]